MPQIIFTTISRISKMISFVILYSIFLLQFIPTNAIEDGNAYYNKINYHNYTTFQEFGHSLLALTEDGQLITTTNVILGVSQPECDYLLESPAFRASQRYAGGNVLVSAALPAREFPYDLDGCVQVFFYKAYSSLSKAAANITNINHQTLTVMLKSNIRTPMTVRNYFQFPVDLYWTGESKQPEKQGRIDEGGVYRYTTFLGDVFSAHTINPDGGMGEIVDFFVVASDEYILGPSNRLETCETYLDEPKFVATGYPSCDDLPGRFEQFKMNVWYQKRLGSNYVQPKFVPAVTNEGFLLRRLPTDTYAWLKDWYDREKEIRKSSENSGVCMNQAVAPSEIAHLTPELKDRLSSELKPILQEWYGNDKPDLKLTSIYGIRKYTNGSVLRMHVDTVNTHVVSAIINVDQKVDKDWPLVILDHDDIERTVIMQIGDMLLYESAKLLHGRPDIFVGEHYDNIFIHYMPESGWDYSWI